MDLQPGRLDEVKEEDGWQIITHRTDWWRTPFASVSWSYFTTPKLRYAKPRLYNGSLFLRLTPSDASSSSDRDQLVTHTDVTLNPDLCGVRGAADAVRIYEANVGFHYSSFPDLHSGGSLPDISVQVDERDLLRGKEQWGVLVESLGGLALDEGSSYEEFEGGNESEESTPSSSLNRSTSTLSSIDSDLSTDSISFPSTPKAKNFEAIIHIKDGSPSSSTYSECSSPARPLNASASSFVPSFIKPKIEPISFPPFPSYPSPTSSPSPPPAFVNFTFPTLDVPPLPPVKIKKDEQGFYSEVKSPSFTPQSHIPSIDLVPPFLQERRKAPASKTRAMVERLRSSYHSEDSVEMARESITTSPSSSPSFYDLTFPQEQSAAPEDGQDRERGVSGPSLEDEDGWLNIAGTTPASPEAKARRTKDLFLALTRRRSDSLPAIKISGSEEVEEPAKETINTTVSSPSLSPVMPLNDGWLEGGAAFRKPQALPDVRPIPPRARTDSRPRSRASRKRRSSNHNVQVPPPPAIPHHFMPPTNPIALAPIGAGMFHPAASISFPVQPPPGPFFQSPYPQMMVPMPPYAPYMLQMQMQAQAQMRGHRTSVSAGGEWFPYSQGVQPFMNPHANMATNLNMTNSPTRRDSLW
jgi:hypothetical protein